MLYRSIYESLKQQTTNISTNLKRITIQTNTKQELRMKRRDRETEHTIFFNFHNEPINKEQRLVR